MIGYCPKTASALEKVEAIILNNQAAERYSRIRFYMQLYSLWRAAMGRMSSGPVVEINVANLYVFFLIVKSMCFQTCNLYKQMYE